MTYPLLSPRYRAAERCFTAFEFPREDTERDTFVVQFLQADIATEIFDVNAIVWEQRVVSQLISRIGEEFIHFIRAKFCFGFRAHFLPVLQSAFAEEATNRQIHRVVS